MLDRTPEHVLREEDWHAVVSRNLNIELPAPYSLPLNVMRLEANEYGGTVSVNIVPCQIFDRKAFLLRTDRNNTVQDITRGTSSKSLRMFGCVMPINLRTEIG
jgi:hypothetical protein